MFGHLGIIAGRQFPNLARLLRDRRGNIALSFALVATPLLVSIGVTFDFVRAYNTQREMQNNIDAALVAAVKNVGTKDTEAIKDDITNWLAAEATTQGAYELDRTSVVIDASSNTVTAKARATVNTTFMRLIGKDAVPVAVYARVVGGADASTKNAFSMYLVLDKSGSMNETTNTTYTTTCYKNGRKKKNNAYTCTKKYSKMEALQLAVGDLLTQLETADPDQKYVRTGVVAYDSSMGAAIDLDWGESAADDYVQNLSADGGTDSSEAFGTAYGKLTASNEVNEHKAKNGLVPAKYIVFMTDGDNNYNSADVTTKSWCDKARTANIQVYTVAFMAPEKGQALLQYCATSSSDYFAAENTAELVAAFKLIGETSAKTVIRLTD
jgi:Flp pilus assembly protein TadG/uncharacterized protein YegL